MHAPRFVALSTALALGCAALGACDQVAEVTGPDPERAATALAGALAAGDLAAVPFAGSTPGEAGTAYDAVVAGMGGVEPTVEAGRVMQSGERATAKWSPD